MPIGGSAHWYAIAMPYSLPLPESLKDAGWKVKISDKERLEPPHVTISFKITRWRWGLRKENFLESEPPPKEIHDAVLKILKAHWVQLCGEWDTMYPDNPVGGGDNDDD